MKRVVLLLTILGSVLVGVPQAHGKPVAIVAVPVVDNPDAGVVAFTFLPDGRIVFGERFTGNVYFFNPVNGEKVLFFTVPNIVGGTERGLLGLAVHPRYPLSPYIYVYATRNQGGSAKNQILRITNSGGQGTQPKVIWQSDVPSNIAHNGGRMLFGPDRKLYFVIGDAVNSANSQDLTNDPGKVHRMTDRGGVPADNPFPGSTIWSYGHRNHYGLDFDPLTGNLWQAENGPHCNDEINLIQKGANYGWGPLSDVGDCAEPPPPPENTNQDGPNPVLPAAWFTPTVAPVGIVFCDGCGLADSEGTAFVGFFNIAVIERVVFTPDRLGIASVTPVYSHTEFSVISFEAAPDGTIYFNDFNTIYKLADA